MKLAVCFFGNLGWYYDSNKIKKELGSNFLKKTMDQISNFNDDTKFFGHLWSSEVNDQLKSLAFEELLIENQKTFTVEEDFIKNYTFGNKLKYKIYLKRRFGSDKSGMKEYASRVKSRWYSTKSSLFLAEKYSKKNKVEFDHILVLRYDLVLSPSFKLPTVKNNVFLGDSANYRFHRFSIKIPILLKIIDKIPLPKSYHVQVNTFKYLLSSFVNYIHVSDTWIYGNYNSVLKLTELYNDFEKYHMSPHIGLWEFLKNNDLATTFLNEQGIDYDLYRFKINDSCF